MGITERTLVDSVRDIQLSRWIFVQDLHGKVVDSLANLKELLPQDSHFEEVCQLPGKLSHGFEIYRRPYINSKLPNYVAFGCPYCKKIVIGPPRIVPEDSHGILGGREGLDYYCTNCNTQLHSTTFSTE